MLRIYVTVCWTSSEMARYVAGGFSCGGSGDGGDDRSWGEKGLPSGHDANTSVGNKSDLRQQRENHTREMWLSIQDIIGSASLWPHVIRRLFWTANVSHFDRLIIVAFVYINGLHPEVFMEWARHMHLGRDDAAYRHMSNLFNIYERQGRQYGGLYGWNVSQGQYEYLDGSQKKYIPLKDRKTKR